MLTDRVHNTVNQIFVLSGLSSLTDVADYD